MINEIVYHGRENHNMIPENVVFFSTDKAFSSDYGTVKQYTLNLNNPFGTCSKSDIEALINNVGSLVDGYDDTEYLNYKSLDESGLLGSDTWELFERYMDNIKSMGYDGMIIYEGGTQNYVSFSNKLFKLQ